jgi:catechol 2,3-dioxygenase-like lactoylglutathione lyase family enzyme
LRRRGARRIFRSFAAETLSMSLGRNEMAARKRAASRRKSRPAARARAARPRAKATPRRRAKPAARRKAPKRASRPASKRPASKRPASKRPAARRPAPKRGAAPRPAASAASRPVGAVPSGIGLVNHHADYTTHDVPAVRRFYVEQLGFTQIEEMPGGPYLSIQTGASSSLGFGPPSSGPPEQWRPPREPALYFRVRDVDRAHRDLVARGVTFEQPPTDMPWGHRVAIVRDPEGRTVYLAEYKTRERRGEAR